MAKQISYGEMRLLCDGAGVSPDPLYDCEWSMSAEIHPGETDETDTIAFKHVDLRDGRYILRSSLDCATGHFTQMFQAFVCTRYDFRMTAREMRRTAKEWFEGMGHTNIKDTSTTWIMCLRNYLEQPYWDGVNIREFGDEWRYLPLTDVWNV